MDTTGTMDETKNLQPHWFSDTNAAIMGAALDLTARCGYETLFYDGQWMPGSTDTVRALLKYPQVALALRDVATIADCKLPKEVQWALDIIDDDRSRDERITMRARPTIH